MRRGARTLALLTLIVVTIGWGPWAAAADPPNPSNGQIAAAQQDSQALAAQLGALQAQAVTLQARIDALQAAANAAIAKYDQTTRDVTTALAAADEAATELATARTRVAAARMTSQQVALETYQNVTPNRTAALLFASDPGEVDFTLAATAYLSARANRQLSELDLANVAIANADARRRTAVSQAETLQQRADVEQQDALDSLTQSHSTQQQLSVTLASVNDAAAHASATLSGLQDQRAAYNAYQAKLAQQAAERAAAARAAAAQAAAQAQAQAVARAATQPTPSGDTNPGGTGATAPAPVDSPSGGTWQLPLARGSFRISTCYCMRWGTFHGGLDMAAPYGTPVYAVGPGTVIRSGSASGFGNWVVVDHHDGTVSIYGHMKVLVAREGQTVSAGTLIAYVGSEGFSTGPHLHFEIRVGGPSGPSTDPTIWLARRGVSM